jgi:hypothetical protein
MSSVCIGANCLYGPRLGGHAWVYINWALGVRANGFDVVWLEGVSPRSDADEVTKLLDRLRSNLRPFGLADTVVLCPWSDSPLEKAVETLTPPVESAYEADAFIDLVYDLPAHVVERFRRSGLVNIDPGLLESWMADDSIDIARHDAYFTIGGRFFDDDQKWIQTRPCVALDQWDVSSAFDSGAFSTVTGWYGNEWVVDDLGEPVRNDKRSGFMPFLDVPTGTSQPLELALDLADDHEDDRSTLLGKGWRVVDAATVSSTPVSYREYVRSSLGEFGWCKPSHARSQSGWISDRTVCYLASGKPAVVQDTGPNPALEDGRGVFRFETTEEAIACLEKCASDYEGCCREAREVAEQHFDARQVVGEVLQQLI